MDVDLEEILKTGRIRGSETTQECAAQQGEPGQGEGQTGTLPVIHKGRFSTGGRSEGRGGNLRIQALGMLRHDAL
jgi:hypothetical protein